MALSPPERPSGPPARLDLLTIGEAMVLLLAESRLSLTIADRYTRSIAGAEATVAIGAHRLGLRTGWISRVGDDPFGEVVRRTMRAEGVELHLRTDPERPTGVLIRDMPATGAIHVQYYRTNSAASALSEADVDADLVRSARLLHLTGITMMLSESSASAVLAAHRHARSAGRMVSFDPNLRRNLGSAAQWTARIAPLAGVSDIVLPGADELAVVAGAGSESDAVRRLLDAGAAVVVVKDGVRGSRAYTVEGSVQATARPVVAIDPVGAGDAFAAGFLSRLLLDHPDLRAGDRPGLAALDRALQTGSAVAAASVAVAGDLDGLPFHFDLDALTDPDRTDVQR